MHYAVLLTEGAERDLEDLYDYLATHGTKEVADLVLDRLMVVAESLAAFPERGSHPRELEALGILDFRQVFFKPYRLIYRIMGKRVLVSLIADGRRELQTLLEARLLMGNPGLS